MLCLYVQAPFAAFRTFTAGSFRPTVPFITFSAAYGLLLNVAGIEMRQDSDKEMTVIKDGLPQVRLALGAVSLPLVHSVYQQLHNYPVGNTGQSHATFTKGNKYNITPVQRSFLSDFKAYVCMEGDDNLADQILDGLAGNIERAYGLPFLGDNNFLLDRLEPHEKPGLAHWWEPLALRGEPGLKNNVARLTITINRADMSQTKSEIFSPGQEPTDQIPDKAWVEVGYP